MSIREKIDQTYNGKAFLRPLFYAYSGGLRFELSEGGDYLNQFLVALRKGMEICRYIFREESEITVCIKIFGGSFLISCLSEIRKLKDLGIYSGKTLEYWSEKDEEWEGDENYDNNMWHYLIVSVPKEKLQNILWQSFAIDFGSIEPRSNAILYLFNFSSDVMVLPYDDRGMDLVGPNHEFLKDIYRKFNRKLLDYDREIMDATFKEKP